MKRFLIGLAAGAVTSGFVWLLTHHIHATWISGAVMAAACWFGDRVADLIADLT